ncbi:MAG: ABC-F family ATP-binding cassette domain-containing protein [Anaerolineales bacterium]|nr:ABC-F family ATP-binding cassette domain-containing protein [Anaerolineales bacterium]
MKIQAVSAYASRLFFLLLAHFTNTMLQLSNISKSFGDTIILDKVSFTMNPGDRLALIGPNGCGKTTLLRIIAGQVQPDGGSVRTNPPDLELGYLKQGLEFEEGETLADLLLVQDSELEQAEKRVAKLGQALAAAGAAEQDSLMAELGQAVTELEWLAARQTAEYDAETVLAGLELDSVPLETPVALLSGGQKTRLGLARLLLRNPRLMLLDEPTNHLDITALEWLEAWLDEYQGAALVVSHDRTFLDRTARTILELDPATHMVTAYSGTYSDYVDTKVREREKHWSAYKDQQKRIERTMAGIRQLSNYAASIEKGTVDFAIRKIAKGIARRATVQKARLERELENERVEKPGMSWQMKLEFGDVTPSGRDVLLLENLAGGYDGVPLFSGVNQVLQAGERVALIGPNGAGKTTLLRIISGQLEPLAGRVRLGANVQPDVYTQEQESLDAGSTPYDTIQAEAAMSETEIRSFLHYFLFTGDAVFGRIGDLSYGERARLLLAKLVAGGCNCLLLDEPINHLDIPSRARFEQAMAAYGGTVLAVVHDRTFIRQFASRIWMLADGRLTDYPDLDQALKRSYEDIS